MSLVELPRRVGPRVFVEPPPDLSHRVNRALDALGRLPDELDLPGLPELGAALVDLADAIEPDADLEDDEIEIEIETVDDLPLFAAARARPP
jgi:hypothetical protein